ncbi:MAG: hypothetical protein Q4G44_06000 [Alcaligenaceae bacterium]|nr:hypothetical protein [Alcaligenaceae bacterium]
MNEMQDSKNERHENLMQMREKHLEKQKQESMVKFLRDLIVLGSNHPKAPRPLDEVYHKENLSPNPETGEVIKSGRLFFRRVKQGVDLEQTLDEILANPLVKTHATRIIVVTDYHHLVAYDRLRDHQVCYSLAMDREMTEDEAKESSNFFLVLAGIEWT